MAEAADNDQEVNEKPDVDDKPLKKGESAAKWHVELKAASTREEKWRKAARDILARYRQERALELFSNKPNDKKMNILYSNTDVMLAHLCIDLGTPDVRRNFPRPGRKTKIARLSAEILEKTMITEGHSEDASCEFEDAIEDAVLPGRGQVWIDLEEVEGPTGKDQWLQASICQVTWEFFRHGPAKRWREVPWVARGHLFSRDDLEDKFPTYSEEIPLNYELDNSEENVKESNAGPSKESLERSLVWEIWDKETMSRIYVAEDFPTILQSDDDPYHVEGFFPCPPPLYMCKTSSNLRPVPLYFQYRDQAEELDRLTTRSWRLMESLKYCGLYGATGDDSMKDVGNLEDGEFIPFKNFAALQQSGGLAGAFMTRDITAIVPALQAVEAKIETTVQRIWELAGISDLMRGDSTPDTTATAERFKARFGSMRGNRRSRIVQRFVRNAYRIKAEIVAEHYNRKQLAEMTGIDLPTKQEQQEAQRLLTQLQAIEQQHMAQQTQLAQIAQAGGQAPPPPKPLPVDPQSLEDLQATIAATPWEDISEVIRSNARRLFMVDVETDDTAMDDDEETKESALEFMTAMFTTLQSIGPAVAQKPELLPLAKELVTFTANAFKVGQAFDDAINDVFDKLASSPPQDPASAPTDPVAAAQAQLVQVQTKKAQADIITNQQKAQADLQAKQAAGAIDIQIKQIELQLKQMELQIKQQEVQASAASSQIKLASQVQDHQAKAQQYEQQQAAIPEQV